MKEIPPFRLVPEPLTCEAKKLPKFRWAPKWAGTRHRLGGRPERLQGDPADPVCPECRQSMTFYAQLDSVNDEYCLGDVGMVYVYVCFDCLTADAIIDTF